jgi:hypothetical protein
VLDLDRGLFLVVADAPLARYGDDAIQRGLSDLDWVSRAAVAHEGVVESSSRRRRCADEAVHDVQQRRAGAGARPSRSL